jgi:hypothetical protein
MCVITTANDGIAGIGTGSRKRDAGRVVGGAFTVLTATDHRGTFIGTRTLHSGALRSLTDRVRGCSTAEIRITFIGAIPSNGDTGVTLADGVLGTTNGLTAFIRTGTLDRGARGTLTDIMGGGATANHGITGIGTGSRESDAKIILTFGVFFAGNKGRALVGAGALLGDALRSLTDRVLGCSAAKEWVAGIGTVTGEGDAGIALAFGVLGTADGC